MSQLNKITLLARFAVLAVLCGCASAGCYWHTSYQYTGPIQQHSNTELQIAFRGKDSKTGADTWGTSEMSLRTFSGSEGYAASALPCSLEFRVKESDQFLTSPTVSALDTSMVEISIGSGGIVTLTVKKEGRSSVTITSGIRKETLSVWTARDGQTLQCGVALVPREGRVALVPKTERAAATPESSAERTPEIGAPMDFAALEGCRIVAHNGQALGLISSDKYLSDSIMNPYGDYGNQYSGNSIFHEYGQYGSQYSALSPFNEYATTPPTIVGPDGKTIAYLTINTTLSPRVDPNALIAWLKGK